MGSALLAAAITGGVAALLVIAVWRDRIEERRRRVLRITIRVDATEFLEAMDRVSAAFRVMAARVSAEVVPALELFAAGLRQFGEGLEYTLRTGKRVGETDLEWWHRNLEAAKGRQR